MTDDGLDQHRALRAAIDALPPEVAELVVEKMNADTDDFQTALRIDLVGKDFTYFANKNCKKTDCYGRGYTGTQMFFDHGASAWTKLSKVQCVCTVKGRQVYIKAFRVLYNAKKKEETTNGET